MLPNSATAANVLVSRFNVGGAALTKTLPIEDKRAIYQNSGYGYTPLANEGLGIKLNASLSSAVYGSSSIVQSPAIRALVAIRY